MGLGELDFDDVVAMKIHGITGEYLQSMEEAGFPLESFDDAVAFRIHGITVAYIEELREAGFEDLDVEEILKIKIFGLDEIIRKRIR